MNGKVSELLLSIRYRGKAPASTPAAEPGPSLGDGPMLRNRTPWNRLARVSAAVATFWSLAAEWPAQAGDILRGGAPAGARPAGSGGGGGTAADAARAQSNAKDALARTSQAVQSVKKMQDAARQMAQSKDSLGRDPNHPGLSLPKVPDGLVPGGLEVAPNVDANPALWQGAQRPRALSQNEVVIRQTSPQAVLHWQTFNVGRKTTVNFDQRDGGAQRSQWVAFNKIDDPSGVPSQILGQIKADGQVYLINPNGIIFGGTSQVNTHALIASSLPINDNLLQRGLLNNPDQQFLFTSLPLAGGANGTPAFTPPPSPAGKYGDVEVQAGAQLSSPTTPERVGGRVALIGTNVKNEGTISTPDGQTILAAANQVALAAHPGTDASLRGLDTYLGTANTGSGKAVNSGLISTARGSTTIAGKDVQQLGVIESTTSVTLNGRIDLLAEYGSVPIQDSTTRQLVLFPQYTGTATLGPGAVLQILPEWSSDETATGTALPLKSSVKIDALAIHLAENSSILAPSGTVELNAGTWKSAGAKNVLVYDRGQVFIDRGATVNVAGSTDISVPVAQNILKLTLRGAELADSPLQREGLLRGAAVNVDVRKLVDYNGSSWVGTPLANVAGYVGLIDRKVGEFTTGGGTIKVNAGESVVLQPGSKLDVSGGYIHFQGGMVATTRLRSEGRLFDIADATPDRVYDGIYTGVSTSTHAKYGITETFTQPLALLGQHYEAGYLQGGGGGTISVTAPAMAIDGELLGQVVAGDRQLRDTATTSKLPTASTLQLAFLAQQAVNPYPTHSPTPPSIRFETTGQLKTADDFALDALGAPVPLRQDRKELVLLSPSLLSEAGFGNFSLENSDGDIAIPGSVHIHGQAGGSFTLKGANVALDGQITLPGGSVDIRVFNLSPSLLTILRGDPQAILPPVNGNRGHFTLGTGATISTAGLAVDDRTDSFSDPKVPLVLAGGSISIEAYSAQLATGSVLDVSGGVALSSSGKQAWGKGGKLSVKAGQDPDSPSTNGGAFFLGAEFRGYSGSVGGTLAVQVPQIQVGGTSAPDGTWWLSPAFFDEGGFSSFTLAGTGRREASGETQPGFVIAPGTVLEPKAKILAAGSSAGGRMTEILQPVDAPEGVRAPVSLAFAAPGIRDTLNGGVAVRGDLVFGQGAIIRSDARASVSLSGDTTDILGSIIAPGGTITISGGRNSTALFGDETQALVTVHLGANSLLSTAGKILLTPDPRGYRTGTILAGGAISISGNIAAEKGAMLDVSGATGILDLAPAYSGMGAALTGALNGNPVARQNGTAVNGAEYRGGVSGGTNASGVFGSASLTGTPLIPTIVDSSAGSITLQGQWLLVSDATLIGKAGGPSATGGSLTISSGRFFDINQVPGPTDIGLDVTQSGSFLPATGRVGIGQPLLTGGGIARNAGIIAVNDFQPGGFSAVNLKGVVQFSGPVDLSANRQLAVGDGGYVFADAAVRLTAPYVALGSVFQTPLPEKEQIAVDPAQSPLPPLPTFGPGSLTVNAQLIDVGNLSLQNIGQLNLFADGGDIRGSGTLDVAGDIHLRAGQVYPVSASKFLIVAYDHTGNNQTVPGTVTIAGSGTRPVPLSAGGTLSIYASQITQSGTLRAPFGTINLGWDGTGASPKDPVTGTGVISGRSVPIAQQITLSPGSVTSVSAIDPATGIGITIPYGLILNESSWIDPTGLDITASGLPMKTVNIGGLNVAIDGGSFIDLRGGGDLYAYRWVQGNGGSQDLLASTSSFAVIPDYDPLFAPYGAFNTSSGSASAANLGGDPGYTNSKLAPGDRVYLSASEGLPAGVYTLLPARYALLAGAYLVTPQNGAPQGNYLAADGASQVAGYRFNAFDNATAPISPLYTAYEVAPSNVIRARAEYADYSANAFLTLRADELGLTRAQRLARDAGYLRLTAQQSLLLNGDVAATAAGQARAGWIDISSPLDFVIGGAGAAPQAGKVVLDSARLGSYGAESLLIGGTRQVTANGTVVTATANSILVNNARSALSAADIILVAKKTLDVEAGSTISAQGPSHYELSNLLIGSATTAGSGDGVLLRVSGDTSTSLIRAGVSTSFVPAMTIGAGAHISGTSLTLDSTNATTLDPTANLLGKVIALNSGRISLRVDDSVSLNPSPGLVFEGAALDVLQSALAISLTSYSTLDLYGYGTFRSSGQLALHAAEIRGFTNGGTVTLAAPGILLDNRSNGTGPGAVNAPSGTLVLDAGTVQLGAGAVKVDQFTDVQVRAPGGLVIDQAGSLTVQGNLRIETALATGTKAANHSITAGGALQIQASAGSPAAALGGAGLGASLSLIGTSIDIETDVLLPSGALSLQATTGAVLIGATSATKIDVGGTEQRFYDVVQYTNGGRVTITADNGDVTLGANSEIRVAAAAGGGDAGSISIAAQRGTVSLLGALAGQADTEGKSGAFTMDVSALADVSTLDSVLNAAAFGEARNYRVRSGDVAITGLATSHSYRLSADQGSITIAEGARIDASGATGGEIELSASGNVSLRPTAELTVRGANYDSAGKGGTITIEAGAQRNGVAGTGAVDLLAGSLLDLAVDAQKPGDALLGRFAGKLHLRAPQNAAGTDLFVNPIAGTIAGASSVLVEGYRLFDLTGTSGVITNTGSINAAGGAMVAGNNIQGSINANAQNFLGSAGTATAGYTAMLNRLLGSDPNGLMPIFVLAPGAEIIHRTGDLTLGATNSTQNADWDLSTFRYGPKGAAGVLTMRAAGNLVFYNALSDGFTPTLANSNTSWLYLAPLSAYNPLLPANTQSWSYRLTAGADLFAASHGELRPITALGATTGLIQLGKNNGTNISNSNGASNPAGNNARTSLAVANRFQVIRTGSGDITLNAGRSVQLLNAFATIYTAGTQVADPTLGGTFDLPQNFQDGGSTTLGAAQQDPPYPAQYSMAGGNVSIFAQENIEHLTRNTGGQLIADSSRQMPVNWLYRRGYIDPATGLPGSTTFGDVASTTWWVDFSNFFQGVGALGGGNVALRAGQDISNVDAVAPTNARMPKGAPDAANLLELGGGDVTIQAGRNIDAGVYYVERGRGTLSAGSQITTNATRSPSLTNTSPSSVLDSTNWLPTTLFLGKGGFDVSAQGDVLLGPVANPFLLPIGINNSFWLKTYFSTYAPESFVNVSSLGGKITLRESATLPVGNAGNATPLLQSWFTRMLLLSSTSASFNQPWLRLGETNNLPFSTVSTLLPPSLRATAFSGDINLVGNLTLSPAANGNLELLAAGAINGLQPNGQVTVNGVSTRSWGAARINVSDADPGSLPGVTNPFAYQSLPDVGTTVSQARQTRLAFLNFIDIVFAESGATQGASATQQTKLALHAPNVLHRDDPLPLRLYANTGDISGLTLFSPKEATIAAGNDITDVSLYIQNAREDAISTVASGRDIVLYNTNSALRVAAIQPGNSPNLNSGPQAGDLQITGEGTLQVLAGRTLDLGTGSNNFDGTGVGITSVGNARNPYLAFTGADLVIGAGIGPSAGLTPSSLTSQEFLNGISPSLLAEIVASDERFTEGFLSGPNAQFLALELFYLTLREAGRDYLRDPATAYAGGFAAIAKLFPEAESGDVFTRGRDIRTRSGGSISIFAPGGELKLANTTIGNPLAPPGIITESGGNISIFTDGDVNLGIGRIFTLRGGNQIIWSSAGNIAAGSASKTVQSAPPTRVLIDPQSADVTIDLAGLATGGGIGVLATRGGVPPGSVDLIAPTGSVDAGDAGIRATGNLNIAAVQILNADNIQVAGVATGIPTTPTVAAPNLGGITAANNATGATNAAASEVSNQQRRNDVVTDLPSVITVEVVGYTIEGETPAIPPQETDEEQRKSGAPNSR